MRRRERGLGWVLAGLGMEADVEEKNRRIEKKRRRRTEKNEDLVERWAHILPPISFESRTHPSLRIGYVQTGYRVYDVSNPARPEGVGPLYADSALAARDLERFPTARAWLDARSDMEPTRPVKNYTDIIRAVANRPEQMEREERRQFAVTPPEDEYTRLQHEMPEPHYATPLPGTRYARWPDGTWHVYDVRGETPRAIGPAYPTDNQLDRAVREYATVEDFITGTTFRPTAAKPTASKTREFPFRLHPLFYSGETIKGLAYAKISDNPEEWSFVDVRNGARKLIGAHVYNSEAGLLQAYDPIAFASQTLTKPSVRVRRMIRLINDPEGIPEAKGMTREVLTARQKPPAPYRGFLYDMTTRDDIIVDGVKYAKVSDHPEVWRLFDTRAGARDPFGPDFSSEADLFRNFRQSLFTYADHTERVIETYRIDDQIRAARQAREADPEQRERRRLMTGIAYGPVPAHGIHKAGWQFFADDAKTGNQKPFGPVFRSEAHGMEQWRRLSEATSHVGDIAERVKLIKSGVGNVATIETIERLRRRYLAERKNEERASEAREQLERERARDERKAKIRSDAEPTIVMMNPKTLELVEMFKKGNDYRIGFFGDRDTCVADAYTAEDVEIDDATYVRIHSPGHCSERATADFAGPCIGGAARKFMGQGYGFLLYSGVAATVYQNEEGQGVFSTLGTRSRDADKLWVALVESGIAEEHSGAHTEEEEVEQEYCCSVDADTGDGEYFTDNRGRRLDREREICETLTVTKEVEVEGDEHNTIDGDKILKKDFVLWTSKGDGEKAPPGDLIARIKVKNLEALNRVRAFIRKHYDDTLYEAFMSRADVLEICGQECLPGLEGEGGKKVPLPPLSDESKELIAAFEKAAVGLPDGGALEGACVRPLAAPPRRKRKKSRPDAAGALAGADLTGVDLGASRRELMTERAGLWRDQERLAFRRGVYKSWTDNQARAKQAEIEIRLGDLERELAKTDGKRVLGDADRYTVPLFVAFGVVAAVIGGAVYIFVHKDAGTAGAAPLPMLPPAPADPEPPPQPPQPPQPPRLELVKGTP